MNTVGLISIGIFLVIYTVIMYVAKNYFKRINKMKRYTIYTASYSKLVLDFTTAQFSLQKQVDKALALGGEICGGMVAVVEGSLTHLCQAVIMKPLGELTKEEAKKAAEYLKASS